MGAHGAGLERRLADAVEILALADVERQRDHLVALDLDEMTQRRGFAGPAGEREGDAGLVSH